jgi:hypothetical protein
MATLLAESGGFKYITLVMANTIRKELLYVPFLKLRESILEDYYYFFFMWHEPGL